MFFHKYQMKRKTLELNYFPLVIWLTNPESLIIKPIKKSGTFLDDNKTLCEPKDFVDLSVNVDDEYFLEPYVENFTPW